MASMCEKIYAYKRLENIAKNGQVSHFWENTFYKHLMHHPGLNFRAGWVTPM